MKASDLVQRTTPALSERIRALRDGDLATPGDFVLYWCHHAMRGHENPALDAALVVGQATRLPVLVYQGLSERYPYAADRHHTFLLQGMADLQTELEARRIACVCHVERSGHRGPHLRTLAERAALLITEDMPVRPTWPWLRRLVETTECPVWCVDTACIVPMQLVGRAYDRAFRFREATGDLYSQRLTRVWEEQPDPTSAWMTGDLPFEPVDVRKCDLAELVGQCEIDHAIGPVPHTPGGSVAGYRRWDAFRRRGLMQYGQRRNDPLAHGVSRLSAYLHYGMVSPLRIARQAAEQQADKFLDELLIWREVAHNLCFHRADHAQLGALPDWAQATLAEHGNDRRPAILSWERLARGETGDPLWDAAQRSLLIHGELHNNVRMTWGKALLQWTPDAASALAMLIDLNHRYALDGRDPCSYGGLLWCLGLFDRPFPPPQPISGTLRVRTTDDHARRLDVAAYQRHATRPLTRTLPTVAVIGAGISGLMCARTLADHGLPVAVLEKSRGVSGRMATRRTDDGLTFDHGAQYFTVRDQRFRRYVDSWIQDGSVQPWPGRIVSLREGQIQQEKSSTDRYVGCPGMNAIGKHLARGLDIRTQVQVASLRSDNGIWHLFDAADTEVAQADLVLVAAPAPQAAVLLEAVGDLAERAASVPVAACWALMAGFGSSLPIGYDGAFVQDSPLSWIARNHSKPGRDEDSETWVLHASPEWSAAHLERSPDHVRSMLLDGFRRATGVTVEPEIARVHLWRYALPTQPLEQRCLFDAHRMIGACGDWCGGPRVEGAFLSGAALAGRVLGLLPSVACKVPTKTQQTLWPGPANS